MKYLAGIFVVMALKFVVFLAGAYLMIRYALDVAACATCTQHNVAWKLTAITGMWIVWAYATLPSTEEL